MADKPTLTPSNGDEKTAAQINEIYSKFHMIENLLGDLTPAIEKISKDLRPTVKDFRIKFERDETLDLVMKIGDNIPLFLQMFDMMKIAQGMLKDLAPAIAKISDDAQPVIKDIRERFEREETLTLLNKIGDNIPFFLNMMGMMDVAKGMMSDMMPAVEKISHDVAPTINMLREKFERDETLEMIGKVGDGIPVLIVLLDLLGKPEMNELLVRVNENMKLLSKVGELLPVFDNLVSFVQQFNNSGTLNAATQMLLSNEVGYLVKGLDKTVVRAMSDIKSLPPIPGIPNLIKAVMDPEVQKGLLMLTKFAQYLPKSFTEAMQEAK